MADWKVSTKEKKSVEEHELWQKGDLVIRRISGFRWGTWTVTTTDDNPPEFDQSEGPGADAVNMYDYCDENIENIELDSLDDGWYGDVIYPDDMEDEEEVVIANDSSDEGIFILTRNGTRRRRKTGRFKSIFSW